nr:hypothetical protein [Pseudonocardia broussonetiae]
MAAGGAGEEVTDLGGGGAEELAVLVDLVQAALGEVGVQASFEADGVVAEDEGVDVEAERDGGVAELADAVHGVQTAGHADLDHVVAERADVADDVDVAGPGVRRAGLDGGDVGAEPFELGPQLGDGGGVGRGQGEQAVVGGAVVGLLLEQLLALPLELAAGAFLLAGGFLLGADALAFGLDHGEVVGGQLDLHRPQRVVAPADGDGHGGAELGDGALGLVQALADAGQGVRADGAHAVVGLGVVGAQHERGEVLDHLRALLAGPVDLPVDAAADRAPGGDLGLDVGAQALQPVLVGDGVLQRVGELVDPGGLQQFLVAGLEQQRAELPQLQLGAGDTTAGGVLLGEDLRELLLGGLAAGGPLDVVERPELGQHGVGPGELHLQVCGPSSSTEDRHAVRPPRATDRGRPSPCHRAPRSRCFTHHVRIGHVVGAWFPHRFLCPSRGEGQRCGPN